MGKAQQTTHAMNAQQRYRFRQALLSWYQQHHRRLPWRARPGRLANPYHVMVSEAMLQQTQVATVTEYFDRFINKLPDIHALAKATEQQVLRLWQGLGYYRRARHLHAAAKQIVDEHGGRIPDEIKALRRLPGVGEYSAGAIASMAFGRSEPVVDGNVARVLARLCAIDRPVSEPSVRRQLWSTARGLLPPVQRARGRMGPGDFNQALMELGAVVCTPRAPRCEACPVRRYCLAAATGRAETLPARTVRRAPRSVDHHVVGMHRRGRFVFQQRDADGLWAGMWQLPTWESTPTDARSTTANGMTARRLRSWITRRLSVQVKPPVECARFTHQTTHRTIRVTVWRADVAGGRLRGVGNRWHGLDDLEALPLSRLQQRAVASLRQQTSKASSSGNA